MKRTITATTATATAVLILLAAGCNSQPDYKSPQNLPTVPMKIGTRDYTLEIVRSPEDRQRGLMYRDSMPANWGMIFVFPATNDADHGFWMKNTRIPLDIIYVDANYKVVSIHGMKPHDETSVNPLGPYKYAIELNAGQAAKTGIKPGDVLSIPSGAKETTE